MSTPTFLVLASNSFSGGWMVRTILDAYPQSSVVGVSRSPEKSDLFLAYKHQPQPRFRFYQCDVNRDTDRLYKLFDEVQPSHVINFAAQGEVGTSWKYPAEWFETNAVGVVKVAHFLNGKRYLKRYVHISTPEVYGSCNNAKEDTPLHPSTPYAASKAAGDMFLSTLVQQYRFPLIMIRSTNVYGKHQQLYRIIPRTMLFLKMGKTVPLHGGGRAIKSYLHIQDVCVGILKAMENGSTGSIYHFSPDRGIAIRDLVEKICTLMGRDVHSSVTIADERPGQDAQYIIDSSKARQELGWQPKISLDAGLRDSLAWVEAQYERLKKEPLEYIHQQ